MSGLLGMFSGCMAPCMGDPNNGVVPKGKFIYVLDCGGQYAHLIASRIRKFEAQSLIRDADTDPEELTGAPPPSIEPRARATARAY